MATKKLDLLFQTKMVPILFLYEEIRNRPKAGLTAEKQNLAHAYSMLKKSRHEHVEMQENSMRMVILANILESNIE